MTHQPKCENCEFFRRVKNAEGKRCTRHAFVMPSLGWNVVCKDWQRSGENLNKSRLAPGVLYYYSYASGSIQASELAPFEDLQNPVLSVSIREDQDLGWVVYPRSHQNFFPRPGEEAIIDLTVTKTRLRVAMMERNMAMEMIPAGDGRWEPMYHTQQIMLLYHEQEPELLAEWLDTYIDINTHGQNGLAPSYFAFIEVLRQGYEYRLHPDLLAYPEYRR